jgi:hypothetical protein
MGNQTHHLIERTTTELENTESTERNGYGRKDIIGE